MVDTNSLLTQLQDRLNQLQKIYDTNDNNEKRLQTLLLDLENIKSDWESAICDLNKHREEYKQLISDLKQIKNAIRS